MKKYLVMLFGIISFIGLNSVNAEERDVYYQYFLNPYSSISVDNSYYYTSNSGSDFLSEYAILDDYTIPTFDEIKETSYELVEKYIQNYYDEYPYYFIYLINYYDTNNKKINVGVNLCPQKVNGSYSDNRLLGNTHTCSINLHKNVGSSDKISISESWDMNLKLFPNISLDGISNVYGYVPFLYFGGTYKISYNGTTDINIKDKNGKIIYTVTNGGNIPSYSDLYELENNNLEIDLNNYAYVALSLKNYNQSESFSTTFTYKGQLCLTPVYSYGLAEKKDVLSGSKNQRCSIYQDNYTSTSVYVNKQDIDNHAIYYLKSYDKTKSNLVKIDQSKFNISYITEENKDNPQVLIDGKLYPTIPFDQLTDTANKSEDEGYIDGVSCRVGDFNCYNEYNPGNIFDIFNKPLEFLKSIWNSITLVFQMINQFILLLPTTLQVFFYFSFSMAIILGIVKILL